MEISKKLIQELRSKTGSGFMDCKVALQKSNGNINHAIDYLRTLGVCIATGKISRQTEFGRIFLYHDKNVGVLLELNSETDFVANNDEFNNFGKTVVNYSGKKKIFILNDLNNIFNSQRISLISRIRENIIIRRIKYITGNTIISYVHSNKIGVLVEGIVSSSSNKDNKNNINQCFKNVAMHIAASRPLFLSEIDIPKDIIEREISIQKNIANKIGKNNHVIKSIVQGRINKFINDITLIRQKFIMDPKIIINDYLNSNSITIRSFIRIQVGENI
ncbi:Elongation factor Ts [Buchnera aphidicola (Cinara kochiana kochiana)]|uniref:Elongation factor Ts n=2 Tax=Buchnera aphidicola TaxID=9 RepID=A0A451D5G8_9GAMM|nr:Elongation factor Ts [Buchnera aphidicola (Cinara kochiana kochiana)]